MVDKRPFVDRRLGLIISFQGTNDRDVISEEIRGIAERITEELFVYPDHIIINSPRQTKVILSESHLKPDTLSEISKNMMIELEDAGYDVQSIEVISAALSPGDRVRNTIGIGPK